MLTTITLIAAGIAAVAVPAVTADSTSAKRAGASSEVKYCIEYEKTTGRRTRDIECHTKTEWAKRGVDVANLDRG